MAAAASLRRERIISRASALCAPSTAAAATGCAGRLACFNCSAWLRIRRSDMIATAQQQRQRRRRCANRSDANERPHASSHFTRFVKMKSKIISTLLLLQATASCCSLQWLSFPAAAAAAGAAAHAILFEACSSWLASRVNGVACRIGFSVARAPRACERLARALRRPAQVRDRSPGATFSREACKTTTSASRDE